MSDAYDETLDLGTRKLHRVDAAGLNTLIKEAWEEGLNSGRQRAYIAKLLGVTPERLEASKPPITASTPSGLDPGTVALIGHYALTYVVGPVAVGLVKDVAKAGLVKVWKDVLLPLIRAKKEDVIEE
jgi:hypothetical protein